MVRRTASLGHDLLDINLNSSKFTLLCLFFKFIKDFVGSLLKFYQFYSHLTDFKCIFL